MSYPVECMLAYDPANPSTHVVKQMIFRRGEVRYDPRPEDGRRIVEFDTKEQQEEAVAKSNGMFRVPTDILAKEQEEAVRRIVRDELRRDEARKAYIDSGPMVGSEVHATTQAIGLAREYAIDLSTIQGTGPDGKITKVDVEKVAAEKVAA